MNTDIFAPLITENRLPPPLPQTVRPPSNPILTLIKRTPPPRTTILDYTRACQRGYIHTPLTDYTTDTLATADTLIRFWNMTAISATPSSPSSDADKDECTWKWHREVSVRWATVIAEELAFRRFLTTGSLCPFLIQKARQIAGRFRRVYSMDIPHTVIFSTSSSYDALVGRAPFSGSLSHGNTLAAMAGFGELALLQWVCQSRIPTPFTDEVIEDIFRSATGHGRLPILRWAINYPPFADVVTRLFQPTNTTLTEIAATEGRLPVLQWLLRHGAGWSVSVTVSAAFMGRLPILRFINEHHPPLPIPSLAAPPSESMWNENVFEKAVFGSGTIQMLQWLRSIGCPWDVRTCHNALDRGDIYIRAWLHKNGCPWNHHYTQAEEAEEVEDDVNEFYCSDEEDCALGEELTDTVSDAQSENEEDSEDVSWRRYKDFCSLVNQYKKHYARLGYSPSDIVTAATTAAFRYQLMNSMIRPVGSYDPTDEI
jgi:hypothetical protein